MERRATKGTLGVCVLAVLAGCSMRDLGQGLSAGAMEQIGEILEDKIPAAAAPPAPPAVGLTGPHEKGVYDFWAMIGAVVGSALLGNGAVIVHRRRFHRRHASDGGPAGPGGSPVD